MPNRNIIKSKKQKGKHSCPSTSGIQNLTQYHIDKYSGKGGGVVKDIYQATKHGAKLRQEYKGKWTDELLEAEIMDYFEFCAEKDLKPAKVGLRLWLGIAESTYQDWEKDQRKHGNKSVFINMANDFMEMQYISSVEKHPTGNIFLLKSSHKHSDKSEIQISGGNDVNSDEIADAVKKLGLDKEE